MDIILFKALINSFTGNAHSEKLKGIETQSELEHFLSSENLTPQGQSIDTSKLASAEDLNTLETLASELSDTVSKLPTDENVSALLDEKITAIETDFNTKLQAKDDQISELAASLAQAQGKKVVIKSNPPANMENVNSFNWDDHAEY